MSTPSDDRSDLPRPDTFVDQLVEAGLERWIPQLTALDRPSVRLRPHPVDDETTIPLGGTKLGGEPDLPPGATWPEWDRLPLTFVAQLGLAEVPPLPDRPLPGAGTLSFFYHAEQHAWGFDPADRGAWRVLWSGPGERLVRRPTPSRLADHGHYRPCRLEGTVEVTHVASESAELQQLGLPFDDLLAYAELVGGDEVPTHRLLGHPDQIQEDDMQVECQLAANGIYYGDPATGDDERAAELRPGAAGWRLLLQVDSDDDADMLWGDAGRLYYWLPEGALAAGDWAAAWMILQSS